MADTAVVPADLPPVDDAAAATTSQARFAVPAEPLHDRKVWCAHAVLWGGAVALLVIAYVFNLEYEAYGDSPLLFPRGAYADTTVGALLSLLLLGVVTASLALLPRNPVAPATTLMRAIGYAITAVVVYESLGTGSSWTLAKRAAVSLAFALIALAWLEARGRRRSWFLGVIPVIVATMLVSRSLSSTSGPHFFLLIQNSFPLIALVALAWFARSTRYRWGPRVQPAFVGDASGAAPHCAGMPPSQNTLSVVGFVLSFFFSVPGIVCGHVALSQIKRTGERGRGLAIAALVIGYVGLAIALAYVLFVVSLVTA